MILINRKITKTKFILVSIFVVFLCGMHINSITFLRLKLANYYVEAQNYDKAIVVYRKILRKETLSAKCQTLDIENISDIRFTLANLFLIKNKFAESVQLLKQIIEINPAYNINPLLELSKPDYYKKFGVALIIVDLKYMALSQFQRAVELAPDDLIGYYHLALMYQKLGKKNKAIAQFEKIIELTKYSAGQAIKDLPSYLGDVYYNLALNFEENEKIEKAKEYYEKALELNSDRIVRIYSRLKFLYEDKLGEIENIETKLLNLKPEYRVNYKFPNDLMLLGYSFNEKKFELFNEGEITFFWELPKQGLGIKSRGGDIYKFSRFNPRPLSFIAIWRK